MSARFEEIKMYYLRGLWKKTWVHNVVDKGLITKAEYKMITGEDY